MLFKLSIRNMKKSYKDYAIYFFTLILGVCLFYMFNSIDSQLAMTQLSGSKQEIAKLLVTMLSGVSIGVSIILGFLIIYANGFLIRRRKREFSIYMTLGMGKSSISSILVVETLIIGCISLVIGLFIGIFASQFMSILVAKMFEADMNKFKFVFSKKAAIKTVAYFGIIFILVLVFNIVSITKYKLIDLMNAMKKSEKVKVKNPVVAVTVFLISIAVLAYAYYHVVVDFKNLTRTSSLVMIVLGCIGTYLFFWSLSGFLLSTVQKRESIYLRGLNTFVLRQINSKINTMVFTMTIICLMLFTTICILSGGLALNDAFRDSLWSKTKADICVQKNMTFNKSYTKVQKKSVTKSTEECLEELGVSMSEFKDGYVEIPVYQDKNITFRQLLKGQTEAVKKEAPMFQFQNCVELVEESDYNKLAEIYDADKVKVEDGKYVSLCTYKPIKPYVNNALKNGVKLNIGGSTFTPQYKTSKKGFLMMSDASTGMGIVVVSNGTLRNNKNVKLWRNYFTADYKASTKDEKQAMEDKILALDPKNNYPGMFTITKISIYDSSVGLSNIVTFIALYLGIIFLITCAAILALKELSETSDNKERYAVLRKIGTDDKMIHKALFWQIGIFFIIPLLLAIVHSIFGIQFENKMFTAVVGMELIKPILMTALFFTVLYGGYFLATYLGSRRIVEE